VDPEYYRPAEVDLLLGGTAKAAEKLSRKLKVSFPKLVEADLNN
jgi:GDPmannose 4,6-dehydratase